MTESEALNEFDNLYPRFYSHLVRSTTPRLQFWTAKSGDYGPERTEWSLLYPPNLVAIYVDDTLLALGIPSVLVAIIRSFSPRLAVISQFDSNVGRMRHSKRVFDLGIWQESCLAWRLTCKRAVRFYAVRLTLPLKLRISNLDFHIRHLDSLQDVLLTGKSVTTSGKFYLYDFECKSGEETSRQRDMWNQVFETGTLRRLLSKGISIARGFVSDYQCVLAGGEGVVLLLFQPEFLKQPTTTWMLWVSRRELVELVRYLWALRELQEFSG